jgi:hypothetical protein
MSTFGSGIEQLFTGVPATPVEQTDRVVEAEITAVSGGKISFIVPEWSLDHGWSDVALPRYADPLPSVGDVALVTFVGVGIDRPWVLSYRSP